MRATILDRLGEGQPLVYVPGIDGTGRMTLGLEKRLAREFEVVRLTYVPEGEDTYVELARSIRERLARAGIHRALVLGESFGGGVALWLALDHAPGVGGMALVNTFCRDPRPARLALGCLAFPLIPGWMVRLARRVAAPRLLFGRLGGKAERRRLLALGADFYDHGFHRRLKMIRALDLRARLGEIRCPVRLFAGSRDLVLDSCGQARVMAAAIPDCRVHIIEGGGHLVLPIAELPWAAWLRELATAARTAAPASGPPAA